MTLEENFNQQRPEDGDPNNTIAENLAEDGDPNKTIAKNLANAIQGDEQNRNIILERINNPLEMEDGDKKGIDLSEMNITDELLVHTIDHILTKKIQVHHIVLNENQLTTLPASIGKLEELQSLDLWGNPDLNLEVPITMESIKLKKVALPQHWREEGESHTMNKQFFVTHGAKVQYK